MKKAKIETLIIFAILIIYFILSQIFFKNMGSIYTFIINPIFWFLLCIIIKIYIKKTYILPKFKNEIIQYTIIAVLIYILSFILSGLVFSYGKNPFSITLHGFLINFWTMGTIIIFKEYIRYLIINNLYENQKLKYGIIIIIIMSLFEINFSNILNSNFYSYFKEITSIVLPIIAKNILLTYLAYNKNYISEILFNLSINIIYWISPIIPNIPWIILSLVNISYPLVYLLYLRNFLNSKNMKKCIQIKYETKPISILILVIILISILLFTLGFFKVKPVSIASGSMSPVIKIGDVVIIKKCEPIEIKVNDIIEYRKENTSIIHRVIEIKKVNGKIFFKTKGDNNSTPDNKYVEENQLIGKSILRIKYIGYPSIWIKNLRETYLGKE